MRVGIITDIIDAGYGGMSSYCRNLVQNLGNWGDQNTYTLIHYRESRDYGEGKNHIIIPFPKLPIARGFIRKYLILPQKLGREDFQVIHDTTQIIALRNAGKSKIVLTIHDIIPAIIPEEYGVIDRFYYTRILPKICRNIDAIITISNHTKEDIIKKYRIADEKIHVIYYGMDERFKPTEAPKGFLENYGIRNDFILHVGSFIRRKKVDQILKAFKIVKEKGLRYDLVLAGSRTYEFNKMRELSEKLRLEDSVIFTGPIPYPDLPMLYSQAKLFIFPSSYEGFGLPPLEAMACGVPTIVSNKSSLPEVVQDAGVTIDPEDEEALAEAIMGILEDENLQKELRIRGLERAKHFSWKKNAELTIKIYERLGKS